MSIYLRVRDIAVDGVLYLLHQVVEFWFSGLDFIFDAGPVQ